MLGVSERTFRRYRDRLRDEGPEGSHDRRIGKPSSQRAAAEEIRRMLGLYQERYEGFPARHFHEQRQKPYNYKLDYTVTRLALQRAGLMRPMVGMMLSLPSRKRGTPRFAWLPGDDRQSDLVVTLEDATSAIDSGLISRRRARRRASRAGRGDRPARAVL